MKRSELILELGGDDTQPRYLRLAAALLGAIERGRLRPGDLLPGTRALSTQLGLHRNTVNAAFHELILQGWLVAEASRGTRVAPDLPALGKVPAPPRRTAAPAPAERDTTMPLRVSDGIPDSRLLPAADLARAFRRAILRPMQGVADGYGDPRGTPALRQALTGYLGQERGIATVADDLIVTRGSQMAIYLAARASLAPGQAIAVEDPGYRLAWAAFHAAGAHIVGVPVDAQGLDVAALESLLAQRHDIGAVYVTPHHQYPTTATLGAGRRLRLLELARRYRLTVIEDDYDHEYRFAGRPVLPLAARAEADAPVIYIGSLSKLLSPEIRLGYAVARPDIVARMAEIRNVIDRQGDAPLEIAMAELIADGTLARHARKARRIYEGRRDRLVDALRRRLGDTLVVDTPSGGLALWTRLHDDIAADAWSAAATDLGVHIAGGTHYALDPARAPNAFRIGFAKLADDEIETVVERLAASRPA
ncbi:PLP-dependent aminotransferase family protein [Propionivibrio dicarboxylicus]|uniref:Transcriptional regulator, GntR family n=1 Tax=Propionivibrio dicarboxylicus TaxID=83767 RepID=A0A1G8A616_9RHOO|nr:PLP-dependent aminotransferase family protein [Propionivibrio dicarboxylicus]SDH16368.1 transcriptional regulator, GntR family [Propionivibrio dicarboxylicus]